MNLSLSPAFNSEECKLLLHIPRPEVEPLLHLLAPLAEKNGFTPKTEFHVTVIGNTEGQKLKEAISRLNTTGDLQILLGKMVDKIDWPAGARFTNINAHLRKKYLAGEKPEETRESYVRLVEVPEIPPFIRKINEIFNVSLPIPFPHITLYTNGDGEGKSRGIGIASEEEFEKYKVCFL